MEYRPGAMPDGSYLNETERNVHVWCSLVRLSSKAKFSKIPTLGLIGGCYIHKGWLPVSVFYKWLSAIIQLGDGEDFRDLVLFACSDPRQHNFNLGFIGIPPYGVPLEQDLTDTMERGHYMLFRRDHRRRTFQGVWPTLVPHDYERRSRTASQTCTPSPANKPPRDAQTRVDVRMRDGRCLATGQGAVRRARGYNFTGLEVAHIFPLKAVGQVSWISQMTHSVRDQVRTRRIADSPGNAILLRADIHSLFDDYQWAVWIEQGRPWRIVRFEKSGAAALDQYEEFRTGSSSLNVTLSPSVGLLQDHFRVALIWHVRGFGKDTAAASGLTASVH